MKIMKPSLKWAKWVAIFGLISIALYETVQVISARSQVERKFSDITASLDLRLDAGEISQKQIDILLNVEDPAFFEHKGIDLKTPGAGLTTITQGLTKQLFFTKFKPGFAKLEQSLIARYAVDAKIDKKTQLETFLNISYLGRCNDKQVQGFSAAAKCYFDKDFASLSEAEYIQLVAMLIGPNQLNPNRHSERLNERVGRITNLLAGECQAENNRDVYYNSC